MHNSISDDPTAASAPMFARASLGGKKNSEVKARITDDAKFDLQRKCHEVGVTESEYVGYLIDVSLYGKEHVESVMRARLAKVVGLFPQPARA